jgi:hypothetical protein
MNQTDLIILAIYFISIYYVLLQAWESIPVISTAIVKHEGNVFDYEALKDFIDVKFKVDGSYDFGKIPTALPTTVSNKSSTATITIDWEKGSLRNFQGGDRRLIRLTDGMQQGDRAKVQASSTISPKRSITVTLTAEDLLEANAETGVLSATKPVVDILKLKQDQAAQPKDKGDAERIQKLKAIYGDFMGMKEPLKFSVRFPLQITNIIEGSKKDFWGFVDCNFSISHACKTRVDQLPWNPNK